MQAIIFRVYSKVFNWLIHHQGEKTLIWSDDTPSPALTAIKGKTPTPINDAESGLGFFYNEIRKKDLIKQTGLVSICWRENLEG